MELPSKEILVKLYRDLLTARWLEAEIWSRQGNLFGVGGGAHRGLGEEAIMLAFCNNLRKNDSLRPNYRNLSCMFARPGYTIVDVIARSMGKTSKNDPWRHPNYGYIPGGGTLGEYSVRWLGAAVAISMKKTDDIAVYIQGDGASNRAPTHEAMAVAAAWQLPIVFVIQNNKYGMGTSVKTSYNIEDLSLRGVGYGFPHERVEGNDMIAMYLVARKHVERCRAGGGPSLIAADTWRLRPHFEGDAQIYRPKGEVEEWSKKDPLPSYTKQLMEMGILTEGDVERLEAEIGSEIEAAFKEVEELPARGGGIEDLKKTAIDRV